MATYGQKLYGTFLYGEEDDIEDDERRKPEDPKAVTVWPVVNVAGVETPSLDTGD